MRFRDIWRAAWENAKYSRLTEEEFRELCELREWKTQVTAALSNADPRCLDLDDGEDAARLILSHFEDAQTTIDARDAADE